MQEPGPRLDGPRLDGGDEEVLWEGRPEVGPRLPDVNAALAGFTVTFGALSVGLAAQRGWAWDWATPLAAAYAGVAAVTIVIGRSIGAGTRLTFLGAFWAVVVAAGGYTAQAGLSMLCPTVFLGLVTGLFLLRYRQRQGLRYLVTARSAKIGEDGRYVLSFALEDLPPELPRIRRDLFGRSLGQVDFGPVEAVLTTREGRTFRVPAQPRRFKRVHHPERILAALRRVRGETA